MEVRLLPALLRSGLLPDHDIQDVSRTLFAAIKRQNSSHNPAPLKLQQSILEVLPSSARRPT